MFERPRIQAVYLGSINHGQAVAQHLRLHLNLHAFEPTVHNRMWQLHFSSVHMQRTTWPVRTISNSLRAMPGSHPVEVLPWCNQYPQHASAMPGAAISLVQCLVLLMPSSSAWVAPG
jgi:hypothetical protein